MHDHSHGNETMVGNNEERWTTGKGRKQGLCILVGAQFKETHVLADTDLTTQDVYTLLCINSSSSE